MPSTFSECVLAEQAMEVRRLLMDRKALAFTEKIERHWLTNFVTFTVTGPTPAVEAARTEIQEWLKIDQADTSW